jgi:hypothetical protein
MTSGAGIPKQCFISPDGNCIPETCKEWCSQTYMGDGFWKDVGGGPVYRINKCFCRYNCSN